MVNIIYDSVNNWLGQQLTNGKIYQDMIIKPNTLCEYKKHYEYYDLSC